jgi:glyoxylase-like metal-dependent hydrolase (beta-lactamase superfamily II)
MAEQAIDKQRPIANTLKSVPRVWREPENPIRWAFAKEMREHDKTKRMYDVDPYAEVYQFRGNLYGIYTHSLDGMGDPWSYLIVGPERAMLIDTSFGVGDLKGLVEEIIGTKPLIVTNTHAHFDHAYGNFQFDRVYCHEYEVPLLKSKMNPHIWDYMLDENGKGVWADFDKADIVPFREYELVGVPDGYVFDLGDGYEVELVFLPGHSPGHAGFLDKRNRIFFPGDDCCCGNVGVGYMGSRDEPYTKYCTVEALYNELIKITARLDEFDGLFPGHGIVDAGPIMLVNLLEACKVVLDNPKAYDMKEEVDFGSNGGRKFLRYGKLIYMSGYLSYSKDALYMDKEFEEETK